MPDSNSEQVGPMDEVQAEDSAEITTEQSKDWPENDQSEVPEPTTADEFNADIEPPPPSLEELRQEASDKAEEGDSNPPAGTKSQAEQEGYKLEPKPKRVSANEVTAPPQAAPAMGYGNKGGNRPPPNKLHEQHIRNS